MSERRDTAMQGVSFAAGSAEARRVVQAFIVQQRRASERVEIESAARLKHQVVKELRRQGQGKSP